MDSAAEFLNDAIRSGRGRVSEVGGFALSEDAESVLQRLDDGTIPTRDADNDAVDDDEADDIDDGGDTAARAPASASAATAAAPARGTGRRIAALFHAAEAISNGDPTRPAGARKLTRAAAAAAAGGM